MVLKFINDFNNFLFSKFVDFSGTYFYTSEYDFTLFIL